MQSIVRWPMYDNATKESWRGWAWNQLCERMGKSYSYAPKRVCVLAGDIAGDMPHADKHKTQCVAVDFDQSCVDVFRRAGGVALQDSLHNQIIAMQPDGLIADMLCGVKPECAAMLADSVGCCDAVVFNFLRGRDKGIKECSGLVPHYKGRFKTPEDVGKHRGKIALLLAAKVVGELWYELDRNDMEIPSSMFEEMKPSFYSYRSKDSGQYFDSVAITTKAFKMREGEPERLRKFAPIASRRKAAAAKAVLARST